MTIGHDETQSPEEYVSKHSDDLVYVIKQSSDPWIRGLCLSALVKYGDNFDHEQLKFEIEQIKEEVSDD